MSENIEMSTYDRRFIRVAFLVMICVVIPPAGLSLVATYFWALNWAVAAGIFLGGSLVGWVIIFIWTMKFLALLHMELKQELFRIYGAFDDDGMPIAIENEEEEVEEDAELVAPGTG